MGQNTLKDEDDRFRRELKEAASSLKQRGEWTGNEEPQVDLMLAPEAEARLIVEDLSDQYGLPGHYILVFKDRKTGKKHPYIAKEGLAFKVEQKGHRSIYYRTVVEDREKDYYEYECVIEPQLSDRDYELLGRLADAVKAAPDAEQYAKAMQMFNEVFHALLRPTFDVGDASPGTVRMRTLRTSTNLRRIAKTRAFRHTANLYTGCGLSMLPGVETAAEEIVSLPGEPVSHKEDETGQ